MRPICSFFSNQPHERRHWSMPITWKCQTSARLISPPLVLCMFNVEQAQRSAVSVVWTKYLKVELRRAMKIFLWKLWYLAVVEDDGTDEPPSAASHLAPVHQVLQLTDLHRALKPAHRHARFSLMCQEKQCNYSYSGLVSIRWLEPVLVHSFHCTSIHQLIDK